MYLVGGSNAGRRRLKTGLTSTFHRGQPYPVEGEFDATGWNCICASEEYCMVDGMSIREASRVFGLHRATVRKMLAHSVPPGYRRRKPPTRPKIGPYTDVIDRILEDGLNLPKKQRHTARIRERLREEYELRRQATP